MSAAMQVYQRVTYGPPNREEVRDYEWSADVELVGCGAGRIRCPACDTGPLTQEERAAGLRWNGGRVLCVECKDTGTVLVSA